MPPTREAHRPSARSQRAPRPERAPRLRLGLDRHHGDGPDARPRPPAGTAPQMAPLAGEHGIIGPDDCLEAAVTALRGPGIAGRGRLCASGSGVRATLQVSGLTPGQTYSAWLGYAPRELDYSAWLEHTPQGLAGPPTMSRTTEWSGGDLDGALRPLGQGLAPRAGETRGSRRLPGRSAHQSSSGDAPAASTRWPGRTACTGRVDRPLRGDQPRQAESSVSTIEHRPVGNLLET